jgi:hypothetical protein
MGWATFWAIFSQTPSHTDDHPFYNTNRQIVTTIESTSYPLNEIPFPAVTICPAGYDTFAFTQRQDLQSDNWGQSYEFMSQSYERQLQRYK